MQGLFINTLKGQCSIYSSGLMFYRCLQDSPIYTLEYLEPNSPTVPDNYDFYVVNYHDVVLRNLSLPHLFSIGKPSFAFHLETSPHNVLGRCAKGFTGYLIPDPTVQETSTVWAFPRPLEPPYKGELKETSVLTIGTFGYPTPGKNWENLVKIAAEEFQDVLIKMNIPPATYAPSSEPIYKAIENSCRSYCRAGVELQITRDYMSKEDLIAWCAGNDLNVFLYGRPGMEGLAACTDQAISSGRPLAVSNDITFRHIHTFIKPYPERTLKEALEDVTSVKEMQRTWSCERFREKFEDVLAKSISS